jgi:ABC-type transport system involved in multi-copper enzyme maturation permease subunit
MNWRLVMAETLKLRKSRGLVIATILMTLGIGVLVILIPELYRVAHPSAGFAGGQRGLQRIGIAVGFIGSIAAMLVGTAAGTGDLSTGIFRDMVATGKSRAALFGSRVPGALVYWLPLITFSYLVAALLDLAFSSHSAIGPPARSLGSPAGAVSFFNGTVPPMHQFVDWYLWILLYTGFVLLVSIGLSSWIGSRAITLGVLIPFQLFVAPILSNISQLGAVREILYPQSIGYLAPRAGPGAGAGHSFGVLVTSSLGIAWLVLVVWVILAIGAGLWRTLTRDA